MGHCSGGQYIGTKTESALKLNESPPQMSLASFVTELLGLLSLLGLLRLPSLPSIPSLHLCLPACCCGFVARCWMVSLNQRGTHSHTQLAIGPVPKSRGIPNTGVLALGLLLWPGGRGGIGMPLFGAVGWR